MVSCKNVTTCAARLRKFCFNFIQAIQFLFWIHCSALFLRLKISFEWVTCMHSLYWLMSEKINQVTIFCFIYDFWHSVCYHSQVCFDFLFRLFLSTGYANEFGEAFRTHIPRLIYLGSYGVASTYCLADSIHKGRCCYQESSNLNSYLQKRKAIETMVEAAVWQGLASVIIPGFTINRICAASRFTLKRCARTMPPHAQMWVTTFVGLSAIPVIIKPIDRWVALNTVNARISAQGSYLIF